MENLRRTFGMAEPIRRGMELKLVTAGEWRPAALGGSSNVHGDILSGRDTEIGWEDVYKGKFHRHILVFQHHSICLCSLRMHRVLTSATPGDELREAPDFHSEMEARMKMTW